MADILSKVVKLAESASVSRSERDLAMWKLWKQSPTDSNLTELLKQINPLIQKEVNKWSGTLARPLLETEGKRLAVKAFETFVPTKGTQLNTHVVNYLQKMSRLSYSNQNVARLPENKMLLYHTYQLGNARLRDELGRAPTVDELADHLGWSIKHVNNYRNEVGRQERLESGGVTESPNNLYESEHDDHLVDFVHHDLPPPQKVIFEHLTGYAGAEKLSNGQIQKKLKMSPGQYNYQKQKMVDYIQKVTDKKR